MIPGRRTWATRMPARRAAPNALVLASPALTACGAGGSSLAPPPGTAAAPASAPPSAPGPEQVPAAKPAALPSVDASGETRVRIVVGDQILHAALRDNPAAPSLLAQLPLTLEFSAYSGQETTVRPPKPLTMTGMPAGDAPVAGDLGYYAPDGDLSIIKDRKGPFMVTVEQAG